MQETVTAPLIDEEELARSFEALGEQRLVPILQAFGTNVMDEASAVVAALTSGETERARRLAHGLKGAASNMSAARLARTAEAIEKMPREAVIPPIETLLIEPLMSAARETGEWIARHFPDQA